jgi:predicted peptidase
VTARWRWLVIGLGLAACRTGAAVLPDEVAATPGITQHVLPLPDGRALRYTLLIPERYTVDRPSPVVLALHYGGTVTPFYGRGILELLVAPALGELGAVIAAPDALEPGWDNEGNERAVLALLDHLTDSLNVDRSRVVCTGYSMGGTGTWYLAGRHPERFGAAIPIAGRPGASAGWRVPVYVIHGRRDQVVPLGPAEQEVAALRAAGVDARLAVVEDATHYQTERFVPALHQAIPWLRAVWERR